MVATYQSKMEQFGRVTLNQEGARVQQSMMEQMKYCNMNVFKD